VACMHDGFKVVHLSVEAFGQTGDGIQSTVLTSFNEHESLAYGVDWSASDNLPGLPSQSLVASGSFYDHSLKAWLA
jgi:diphthine methyl ester acylhydrolase